MSSIDNKYYIQALDSFQFSLVETVDALTYSLSYNPDHAASHCLMGRIFMEQLEEYEPAREHFQSALNIDVNNVNVYKWYSLLLIKLQEFNTAEALIKHSFTVKGIDKSAMLQRQALLAESRNDFIEAKRLLKESIIASFLNEHIEFLRSELHRVKNKLGKPKKKHKSDKAEVAPTDKEQSKKTT
ncbi:MAG: tetratricopeptide (TPR) repeat protein [Patiriisocius sp.]|jgi:tetratricopeptide (TPR) repeat protein